MLIAINKGIHLESGYQLINSILETVERVPIVFNFSSLFYSRLILLDQFNCILFAFSSFNNAMTFTVQLSSK